MRYIPGVVDIRDFKRNFWDYVNKIVGGRKIMRMRTLEGGIIEIIPINETKNQNKTVILANRGYN